jgi:hypothetical protein
MRFYTVVRDKETVGYELLSIPTDKSVVGLWAKAGQDSNHPIQSDLSKEATCKFHRVLVKCAAVADDILVFDTPPYDRPQAAADRYAIRKT